MDKGFAYTFPAKVGDTVYLITRAGFVRENTVDGYIISGGRPHDNRVRLTYFDRDGVKQTHYRNMSLFGKTVFTNRSEAERAVNEDESSCCL